MSLQEKCDLLIKNKDALKGAFKWEDSSMLLAGSSFYVGMNLEADITRLKECETILKSMTKPMSEYRGMVKVPLLCKMGTAADPAAYLQKVIDAVNGMKHLKWIDHAYKILAAMVLLDHTGDSGIPAAIERMTVIYQGMKENHPWLTSDEDIPFAAMLAASDFSVEDLFLEMETCYKILTGRFHEKDAVQSLSHVVAVNPIVAEEKCDYIFALFDRLKTLHHKYGTGYELAVLGTLAILDLPVDPVANEIVEADEYLKTHKGFGNFTMGESIRRMYAALMVMDHHLPPASQSHEALVNSMLTIAITMEICMIILMTTMVVTTTNT